MPRQDEFFSAYTTRHPGSKKRHVHKAAGKGNVWRAVSRPLRSYPGWKKRVVNRVRKGDLTVGDKK